MRVAATISRMGLEDRDYMRRRPEDVNEPFSPEPWWKGSGVFLFALGLFVCVLVYTKFRGAKISAPEEVATPAIPIPEPENQVRASETTKSATGNSANESSGAAAPAAPALMNINSATYEQLLQLPEIGPFFAKAIIEKRPFRSHEGLLQIARFGRARMETIRKLTICE